MGYFGLIGRPVSLEWFIDNTPVEQDEIVDAVNMLVRRRLLQEVPSGPGWGLELVDREAGLVAWDLLDEDRRSDAAVRCAHALSRDHADHPVGLGERPALIARTYLRVGMHESAIPLLAVATRNEVASGRTATGLAMADLWVESARITESPALHEALEARVALATTACEWSRAEDDLQALTSLADGEPERMLEVLTARAIVQQQTQDQEGVIETVEEAFRLALQVEAPPATLLRLSHLIASVDFRAGSLIAARDRWLGVASQAQASGLVHWQVVALTGAASADLQLGEFAAAADGYRHAANRSDGDTDPLTALLIDLHLARLTAVAGDPERGLAGGLSVAERASELGALGLLGRASTVTGHICRRLDRLEEAQQHLERAERILRATEQRLTLTLSLAEAAQTALRLGDVEAAYRHATAASTASSHSGGTLLEQERVHCALGRVAEMRGDRMEYAAARQRAVECIELQARTLSPDHLGRWVAVAPRLEVVTWTGWSPSQLDLHR